MPLLIGLSGCTMANPEFDRAEFGEGESVGPADEGDGDGDGSSSTGNTNSGDGDGDGDGSSSTGNTNSGDGDGDGESGDGDGDGDGDSGDGDGDPEPTCDQPPPGMVCIPEGPTTIGCAVNDPACEADELPVHQVILSEFFLDVFEVTVGDYGECVEQRSCEAAAASPGCTGGLGDPSLPINCVSWFQAQSYCAFRGKQLPTAAQWERAAGGPAHAQHPWGAGGLDCTHAVTAWCDFGGPLPVGSLPLGASEEGVFDLIGNVAEWVEDWYDAGYYANSPELDPQGPAQGSSKSARGGAHNTAGLTDLQSWDRGYVVAPLGQSVRYGFRCAG